MSNELNPNLDQPHKKATMKEIELILPNGWKP